MNAIRAAKLYGLTLGAAIVHGGIFDHQKDYFVHVRR
jgi:hypothetical protein